VVGGFPPLRDQASGLTSPPAPTICQYRDNSHPRMRLSYRICDFSFIQAFFISIFYLLTFNF
jgi:hypothetical protein